MSTTFQAYRSTSTTLPVFILSNGDANVNISLWLTDEEALQLASELRAAVAKGAATAAAAHGAMGGGNPYNTGLATEAA